MPVPSAPPLEDEDVELMREINVDSVVMKQTLKLNLTGTSKHSMELEGRSSWA